MNLSGPTTLVKVGALALTTTMLMAFLVLTQTSEASAYSSPCPHYAIQDVFDDPSGNWDGDLVNNADELYNGLNPCILDTQNFCGSGGNPLCNYPTTSYYYVTYPSACETSIRAFPDADYDGDGVSNQVEINNGANPCTHPCPNPRSIDLALNPNGSWDSDGISNAIEVSDGTNPCDGYRYNPCPRYSYYQVDYMPGLDWDGDGVTNSAEVRRGTNPCVFNTVRHVPHTTTTQRLPHVTTAPRTVYIAPRTVYVPPRAVTPVCPAGYPYYHPGNGLCYANPVNPRHWY